MAKSTRLITRDFWQLSILLSVALIALLAKMQIESQFAKNAGEIPVLKPLEASYQSHSLKIYNFGFPNLIADLIWVQLLQLAQHTPVPDDEVSWEYSQLDAITALDPSFERAYSFGAIFLSIFRQDKLGAKNLLEKWVKRRPIYWKANYFLGHHLYFEMGDRELAAKYLLKASTLEGAPYYLSALGIRLLEESQGLYQALKMSCDVYPNLNNPDARARLGIRIRSIVFALQKSIWNQALGEFRKTQRREPSNLQEMKPFYSLKSREIAQTNPDENLAPELQALLHERFDFEYSADQRAVVSRESLSQLGLESIGVYKPKEKSKK
jgi:hypothetical protein